MHPNSSTSISEKPGAALLLLQSPGFRSAAWLLAAAAIPLLSLGAINFYADPFQQYRNHPKPRYWHALQRYITPGLAKRGDYTNVIVGSSMFESFRLSDADRCLGGKTANLSLSAISAYEEGLVLDLAFRQAKVKRVVLDLNVNTFAGPTNKRWVADPLPWYLWDSNPFNDVRYLLSLDTLTRSRDLLENRPGGPEYFTDQDLSWGWARTLEFSGRRVVSNLDPADLNRKAQQQPRTLEEMMRNFDVNILPHIRNHPETRFDLVHPPYSVLVWADFQQRNQVEVTLDFKRQLFERIQGLPNVAVHDFQLAPVTQDLSQYTDIYHFGIPTCTWMLEQMRDDGYRVTKANLAELLEKLRVRAREVDPKRLIESNR
jgi:hypothetical protein